MGLIQDYLRRMRERKARREGFEGEQHMTENFSQKKLSANERELMRYREEERQKRIKQELDYRRKQENDKMWSGHLHNPVDAQNVVAHQKNLFMGGNMFSQVPDVVTQPNIFQRKDMFFRGGH